MAREKFPTLKLHELLPAQPANTFGLLVEKTRGLTRDGKPFFTCKFRDLARTVGAVIWADAPLFGDCEKAWHVGTIYKLRAVYQEHEKYGPQIEVLLIRETNEHDREEGLNEADFYDRSRYPSDAMFTELRSLAEVELKDVPLRSLVVGLLDTHAATLKQLPASFKQFYPYPGGWLEHILNVTKNCCWLADQYAARFPELKPFNRDLVIAGAITHDLGRVAEWTLGPPGQPPEPTVAGHLFGHIQLARDLVRTAAASVAELSPELLQLLEHVILSHLTRPEWGSPRLPVIPEVLILHHADDLDAKFEMFARHIQRDRAAGPLTERDPVLGKQLLKGRAV